MAQDEYQSAAGPYVEALRTVRAVKNLFFGILVVVILFLVAAFFLVRYVGVLTGQGQVAWDNWLNWAFSFSAFLGVVFGCLYALTLLIGLKISLAGRLEGAAGLTKGFFWALFFLAIFLPWQHVLVHKVAGDEIPILRTVPGVLYGFEELKRRTASAVEPAKDKAKDKDTQVVPESEQAKLDVFREALLAVRFILYPLAALLLLVAAQSKYRPQRVEIPEPVAMSRLAEQTSETS